MRERAATSAFDRCNLFELALRQGRAHSGDGVISFCRLAIQSQLAGCCNFLDYAEIPAGCSVGRHRHAQAEEEYYLVLSGEGEMWRDGEEFTVRAGELVRNPPGGAHGLRNTGKEPIRLFVFELPVPGPNR